MSTAVQQRKLLTVHETAELLRVSDQTVRRLIARGTLPALQLDGKGSSLRIDPRELSAWLYGDPGEAA